MSAKDADRLKVFTGRANPQLAEKICKYLQIPLGEQDRNVPGWGIDHACRGGRARRSCYIVQSTSHPINAHLMELFIWIDTLKRASAAMLPL